MMARRHRMADGTRGRISAIPAGTGHGGDYRPLCSDAVPMISTHTTLCPMIPASKTTSHGQLGQGHHRLQAGAPDQPPTQGLDTVHQGLGYLGVCARRDPPLRCSLGTDQASASRTVRPHRLAHPPPHPLRGSPRALTTHRIGWDWHAAPVLQGRTTPTTTPPQEQATGLGHAAPVGTTPHS